MQELSNIEIEMFVGGNMTFNLLENLNNITLKGYLGGDFIARNLKKVNNSSLFNYIDGDMKLNRLSEAKKLILPKKVKNLHLDSMKSLDGILRIPNNVSIFSISKVSSMKSFTLPEEVKEYVVLDASFYKENKGIIDSFKIDIFDGWSRPGRNKLNKGEEKAKALLIESTKVKIFNNILEKNYSLNGGVLFN